MRPKLVSQRPPYAAPAGGAARRRPSHGIYFGASFERRSPSNESPSEESLKRPSPDASGSLLTASAVLDLDLDADTVILSACNSGGPGGTTAGESLSGLARSFFYAGARSLMVTHWSVNDQIAAYLVADTLRRLKSGEAGGIAASMRAAQLGMLDEAGKTLTAEVSHPFYWAPFAVIGEGGQRRATTQAAVSVGRAVGL